MPIARKEDNNSSLVSTQQIRSISHNGTLSDSDFSTPIAPKKRAIILIYGDGGTGKTSFCVRYAPCPIAVINFDHRAAHAVHEATELGRNIVFAEIDFPSRQLSESEALAAAQDAVSKTMKNLEIAVEESKRGNIRSILLDTGTEYSEILKLSFDGVIGQTKKGAYGKDKDYVNRQWWRIFNLAREGNAHLIITARAKEIWIKNSRGDQEATGRHTYRCPEVINDGADWTGQIRLKKGIIPGRNKKEFELEIVKAGTDISQLGEVYDAEQWDSVGGPFVYSCWMNYNNSTPEDWK